MRSLTMTGTTLAALLLAGPVLAQAPADPALRELQREQAAPAATPSVPAQNRNATEADADGIRSARGFLAEAKALLIRRNAGRAIEAIERAETRLLTNSVVASEADRPQSTSALSQMREARRLASSGNATSALHALDRAEEALPATPVGPGARPLPPGVPTGVDAPVPPRPMRSGPRPATPPGPGMPAERLPPRG